MVNDGTRLLDSVKLNVFQRGRGEEHKQTNVFMLSPFFLLKHREPQSSNAKLSLRVIPVLVDGYAFAKFCGATFVEITVNMYAARVVFPSRSVDNCLLT